MNYKKIYDQIIEKRKLNIPIGYYEKHHILPRSLGGDNSKTNIVKLTAREHFICHYLLMKIYDGSSHYKMAKAFMMMKGNSCKQQRYMNSILYESSKRRFSEAQRVCQAGSNNSQFGKKWIHNKLGDRLAVTESELITYLNEGWILGKVLRSDTYRKGITQKMIDRAELTKQKKIDRLKLLYEYHSIYIEHGFEKFKEITNYQKSWQNLVMLFKTNIPEFVPANTGKKSRGN